LFIALEAPVFENIIAQAAADQLWEDIVSRRLAPSMLFFGPPASAKGSAALELARALSCEYDAPAPEGIAPWNCTCPACVRHRLLIHSDLLMLGPRPFAAEIAAARSAVLRDPSVAATRTLFIRSLRKLLARFSPTLWEDDPKLSKLSPLLQSLEEDLDEFEARAAGAAPEKLCDSLLKNALKLEDEGMGETIPIAHVRRAAYWSRLAPNGRRKTLLIENADRMQDGARNSLLKLLEEPPGTVSIILTVQRREAVLPTILSRLRPYRFLRRDGEKERELIRRVFRDPVFANGADGPKTPSAESGGMVSAYIDSFLPQNAEKLYPLAAFFIAALARAAAVSVKKQGRADIPAAINALGSLCAPIAEAAGLGKAANAKEAIGTVLAQSGNFEARAFPRFLRAMLDLAAQSLRQAAADPRSIAYNDLWRRRAAEAEAAAGVWNQNPALALESLFCRLKESLAAGTAGPA
jgi:DNA polymerase-3 subunit gamma/tau